MRGAGKRDRGTSRLSDRRRRLLQAAARGALMVPEAAWGQTAATLPEVTVVAPRPAPPPPRRQVPAPRRAAVSRAVAPAPLPAPSVLPALQVIATTPVTGIGFDRSKVPAMVQTLTADDFSRVYSPSVVDTLAQRIPGVVTSDIQGNSFFQDLRYRGFAASPLQGTPQGLALYMQGVRVNEAFGDTVNWDLIPTVAIGRADIWTNNPAFGLNALGGAVSLQMKDGFYLQRYRGRCLRWLLWARRRLDTIRCAPGRVGTISRRRRLQGRRLALPVAVAAPPPLQRPLCEEDYRSNW